MRWSRGGNLGLAATVPPSHSHHFKLAVMKIQNESIFKSVLYCSTSIGLSLICCCYISLVALVAQPSKSKSSCKMNYMTIQSFLDVPRDPLM